MARQQIPGADLYKRKSGLLKWIIIIVIIIAILWYLNNQGYINIPWF
ncbi:hypothetical protein JW851_01560 [Candidatus Woesearchaeota archaeon]|nr:hypothetical protein [Candidatus Woesearchaeota archaeon]